MLTNRKSEPNEWSRPKREEKKSICSFNEFSHNFRQLYLHQSAALKTLFAPFSVLVRGTELQPPLLGYAMKAV